jgi:site-specific recombinase XerC
VRRALAAVRIPTYRPCLTTIYACGLRANEGTHLQVPDVDSARLFLRIHGNGRKDRLVTLLQAIRKCSFLPLIADTSCFGLMKIRQGAVRV